MTVQLENANGGAGARIAPERYAAVRDAMLEALAAGGRELTWEELVQAIAPVLPQEMFPHLGSVRWHTKAVQLDLEARGLIERVPKTKPLRLRRSAPAGAGRAV